MWWMFEKLFEKGPGVFYAYSRGNRNLDGKVSINRDTKEIELVSPSSDDAGIQFAEDKAIEKASLMIQYKYPQQRQVACG